MNTVVDVSNVSKKFCRHLKRSLWYGMRDLASALTGSNGSDRLQLRRGEFLSVDNASFQVNPGECVSLLGPNGAGKSTILKMINGLIKPDAGTIRVRGRTGALIELGTGFNPILSGRENVYINAAVLGMSKTMVDQLYSKIVDFSELQSVMDAPVQTYSSGMRVRLGFSVAAHLNPQLLLIDEVLAVGDVGFRMKCFDHLRKLVRQGVAIIVVSHAVSMLSRISERAVVFDHGKVLFDGDLERGIGVYESTMTKHATDTHSTMDQGKREARITCVEVRNEDGQIQKEFSTGDSIAVRIKLDCDQTVENARLIVALHSPNSGSVAMMSTPYQNIQFDIPVGGTEIELTLTDVPLLVGGYYFNVSLFGPASTDFYQRRSGVGAFRIIGPPTNADGRGINGLIQMKHNWHVGAPSQ